MNEFSDSDAEVLADENSATNAEASEISESSKTRDRASSYSKETVEKHFKSSLISKSLEDNDVPSLKRAAIAKWGLLDDETRRKVWPKLAKVDIYETVVHPTHDEIISHPYYNQVVMDVDRSLCRFPPSVKVEQRMSLQDQLVHLIMRLLIKHPQFHYYQGFHDICVTFLLILGEEGSFHILNKITNSHLKDHMEKTMEKTVNILWCLYSIIEKENPILEKFLLKSEVGVAFCLSWVITWYSHVLKSYEDVGRLFDLFLVSHPWMPLYLSSAFILQRADEVLTKDCDMPTVHSTLSNIPDSVQFEELITDAISLYKKYPPKMLLNEKPWTKAAIQTPPGSSVIRYYRKIRFRLTRQWYNSLMFRTALFTLMGFTLALIAHFLINHDDYFGINKLKTLLFQYSL